MFCPDGIVTVVLHTFDCETFAGFYLVNGISTEILEVYPTLKRCWTRNRFLGTDELATKLCFLYTWQTFDCERFVGLSR